MNNLKMILISIVGVISLLILTFFTVIFIAFAVNGFEGFSKEPEIVLVETEENDFEYDMSNPDHVTLKLLLEVNTDTIYDKTYYGNDSIDFNTDYRYRQMYLLLIDEVLENY